MIGIKVGQAAEVKKVAGIDRTYRPRCFIIDSTERMCRGLTMPYYLAHHCLDRVM